MTDNVIKFEKKVPKLTKAEITHYHKFGAILLCKKLREDHGLSLADAYERFDKNRSQLKKYENS